jgi:hypothetical protein
MLYIFNQFGGSSLNIFQLYGFLRNYIKRTVEQMLGNIASRKELWMSGTKYQRK